MRLPSHAGRALVSATLLSAFLALLHELDRRDLAPSLLRLSRGPAPVVLGLAAAAGFACALAPIAWRRAILLAAALIAAPVALGAPALVLLGYAVCVIAVARAGLPVLARLAIALLAWLPLPVVRTVWLDGDAQADTILLAIVWAGQLYAAFYVIVERERELPAQRTTVLADAFYLLALPRLIAPFFQPISPGQLAGCERPAPGPRVQRRAAGLAGYAAASSVLAVLLGELAPQIASRPLALAVQFGAFYARATCTIFTAIAVFRLLGYDLPSGFRRPFLSRSFAEFFRRYNHYVRDAVVSLFYFPLLGRLRHGLPARAASIAAAYLAIAAGSFALHDFLIPMAITVHPQSTSAHFLDPVRVAAFVALWTLIIVPTAGLAPRREPPRSRARTIAAIAAFNAVYFALWYLQEVARGWTW